MEEKIRERIKLLERILEPQNIEGSYEEIIVQITRMICATQEFGFLLSLLGNKNEVEVHD
jgi:hypothetical protein